MDARNDQPGLRPWTVAALLILFAGLVLWRIPAIVAEGGRFWAEEGTTYFTNAWTKPWDQAWFSIHTGYINFAAGFSTWLALAVGGIRWAPSVTLAIALLFQCLPAYIVLTHDFPWRRSALAATSALLLCALVPISGEVWLNTITSQFHLGLAAALILAAPLPGPRMAAIDCVILAFATLSGPVATFLTPLFCLRAAFDRRPWRIAEAAIVVIGFTVQAAVYLGHTMPQRGSHLGPAGLVSIIAMHTLILPLTGIGTARIFGAFLLHARNHAMALIAGVVIFLAFYLAIGAMIARARLGVLAWLLAACLVISLVSFYEALNGTFHSFGNIVFGGRYAFVPIILNGLLILGIASGGRPPLRYGFMALALLWLGIGASAYRSGPTLFRQGPRWASQVAAWRRDPGHIFTVWPGGNWVFRLPPREHSTLARR